MFRFLSIAALLLFLVLPASAQILRAVPSYTAIVQDFAQVDDLHHRGVNTRRISGSSADYTADLMAPGGAWLYGIEMSEKNDRPCHARVLWATIDNGTLNTGSEVWNHCTPTPRSLKALGQDVYPPTADNGGTPLTVIRGLNVCQRNSNDRLKGMSLTFGRISTLMAGNAGVDDVDFQTVPEYRRRFERPNCNDWGHTVTCPANQVVVGLQISAKRSSGADQITGLAPTCALLRVQR